MNPALSPMTTGTLPRRRARLLTSSTTSCSVTTVRITSTSLRTGAGLKKCIPMTADGRPVATEISVTDRDEVFVARIVVGGQILSSAEKTSCLRSSRSGTASMTSSAVASSSSEVVNRTRPSRSRWASLLSLPRCTARSVEFCRWPRPRSRDSSVGSTPMTCRPSRAKTSTMPAPIVPRPTTPTVVNSLAISGAPARLTTRATAVCAARAVSQVAWPPVRLVIARCTVDYVGRLTAHLPSAPRLILVKADGSVSLHADDRAYKPLNWMSPPCSLRVDGGLWAVTNKAGEQLLISIEELLHDSSHELGVDPGLVKDGVEAHLQVLLAERCEVLGDGFTLVRREYMTDIGPVDLLCRDAGGAHVAIEIKRRGEIDGVEQLTRYLELLNRDPHLTPVRGVFAAQEIKPQARVLAQDRGISCVTLDYDRLRGTDDSTARLF